MNDFYIGALCGGLTMFIWYIIGQPGSKYSPHEIFSFYTNWLVKRRLRQVGLWPGYSIQLRDNLKNKTRDQRILVQQEFNKLVYQAADPFFTWERAVGMCPVCTGVWVTFFSSLVFTRNVLDLLIIIVISHTVIRLLNRIYE